MGEWKFSIIKEIANVNMGQSPNGNSVNENEIGIPFLQGNADFQTKYPLEQYWCTTPKKYAKPDDVLVSVRAPVGEINIADKKYCIGRGLSTISFEKIDKIFGFYSFFGEIRQLHKVSQGTTFLAVSKSDINKLKIFHPINIKEQSKITEILTSIDVVIEKTRAIIKKYKNIKTGLMQDLLTNGIDKNGNVRSQKTHKYKDTALGKIPVEWECVPISSLGMISSGSTPSTTDLTFWNGDYVWLTPVDLSSVTTPFTFNSSRKLTWKGVKKATNGLIPKDSVIISCRAPVGYCAVVKSDFSFNQGCKSITPSSNYNPVFIYYFLKMNKNNLERYSSGTTFLELSKKEFSRFSINIPFDINEQGKIVDILTSIDDEISENIAIMLKYIDIKIGLMQDLLTHKVAVDKLL
jgi:type I restriction enzyme S subunit